MFKAATNPYDELVVKATSEDLVSEDWDTNLQICDKVQDDGDNGAKNVIAALMRRLSHRNPNVQMFSLELANSLAQNCGRPAHAELSSRPWTGALERLITDRTTLQPVRTKALGFVQEWNKEFGGDTTLGVIGELYESLRSKKYNFDEGSNNKGNTEDEATRRARQEDEELQRVLELSKQDKGGRNAPSTNNTPNAASSSSPSGSGSSYPTVPQITTPVPSYTPGNNSSSSYNQQPAQQSSVPKPYVARDPTPPPLPTRETASRVRAIYPFVTQEKAELSFQKGDVIKVIDRMYDEWYTGAVGGRIGIFPISYVEPLPDPTAEELQKEAQEEARVFAAQGMIVSLQRMLDSLDPSRGDRVDNPELEDMYQKTVALQPQIMGLMKKYSDQKAELEHIHRGFVKASRQYVTMTQPQAAMPIPQPQPQPQSQPQGMYPYDAAAAQGRPNLDPRQSAQNVHQGYTAPQGQVAGVQAAMDPAQQAAADQHAAAWAAYYAQMAVMQAQAQAQGGAVEGGAQPAPAQQQYQHPSADAVTEGGDAAAESENTRAWREYYAAQAAANTVGQPDGAETSTTHLYNPYPAGSGVSADQAREGQPLQQNAAIPQQHGQYAAYPNGNAAGINGLTREISNLSVQRG